MAAKVGHRAIAEIPPAVPLRSGEVDLVERPLGRGPEPQVPVEIVGHGHRFRGPLGDEHDVLVRLGLFLRLQAPGPADPHVHLAHRADRAGLNQFDDAAIVGHAVDLGAHLRGDAGLFGRREDAMASSTLCVSGFSQ